MVLDPEDLPPRASLGCHFPPIGIHLLMGDNAKAKLENYVRNLSEDCVSVALGMAHKK